MTKETLKTKREVRPPVVSILGHVDHGKSSLLDYIRKENTILKEAGGITQHISSYEITHNDKEHGEHKITFVDTPGHAAFMGARERGASVADIAILIIDAGEGVKDQTKESIRLIKEAGIPYVVALNKIDKPSANVNKVKQELAENDVLVEGFGGVIPCVEISSKTGEGINNLLEMLILVSEIEENSYDKYQNGSGYVLESNIDPNTGITATVIVKDGTLRHGAFFISGGVFSKIKRLENFEGKVIIEATPSTPVKISGLSGAPEIGGIFETRETKSESDKIAKKTEVFKKALHKSSVEDDDKAYILPVIIKADVLGTISAIESEIMKLESDRVKIKVLGTGVGNITEGDIKLANSAQNTIVIGFNVGLEKIAKDLADSMTVAPVFFDIIYKIPEYLSPILESRKPVIEEEIEKGKARVIKIFNKTKSRQVIGLLVSNGSISISDKIRIERDEEKIGNATFIEMQVQKIKVKNVNVGDKFGACIDSKIAVLMGDSLVAFTIEKT